MLGVLALLFLVVPLVELYLIVQVAGDIGVAETILVLIAISLAGAWLARRAGLVVLHRMQVTIAEGRVPSRELVDGALVLLAGALLITPGFVSDCVALALLLPPIRALARTWLIRRIRARGRLVRVISTGGPGGTRRVDVWDADGWEEPPESDPPSLGAS